MLSNQKGQTIASVLLIMVVALSIGVAIATRFTKTLRQNVGQDNSSRALAIAEAGIERMLNKDYDTLVDYINYSSCGSDCTLQIVGGDGVTATATITLSFAGNSSNAFAVNLSEEEVVEVSLNGYPDDTDIYVCWNSPASGSLPSVVGSYIHGTDGNYGLDSYAVNSIGSLYATNGFDDANSALGYANCFTIDSKSDPEALRLRSLYNEVNAYIVPDGSATIPSQGVLISSVGIVQDSERKVDVLLSSPAVPLPFDYVLYSKDTDNPLSN